MWRISPLNSCLVDIDGNDSGPGAGLCVLMIGRMTLDMSACSTTSSSEVYASQVLALDIGTSLLEHRVPHFCASLLANLPCASDCRSSYHDGFRPENSLVNDSFTHNQG